MNGISRRQNYAGFDWSFDSFEAYHHVTECLEALLSDQKERGKYMFVNIE
jgi:hypothetical protein